jgi:RNA polymerase sigma-70 factor (ECF subfamily)
LTPPRGPDPLCYDARCRNTQWRDSGAPPSMATRQEFNDFLAAVERRAFKQALYAVRNEETALDLVQEAMLRLTERYADRPAAELGPLFQRILQNAIYDQFRRDKVRRLWTTLLSSFSPADPGEPDQDPLEFIEQDPGTGMGEDAANKAARQQVLAAIEAAIRRLPNRQREAFLLRYWEEFDVAQTAAAMGCSEGSVKTHCSRAIRALAAALRERGITDE